MLPEIFPLFGEELRNWLMTAGQKLFTGDLSGAEALELLREAGGQIRTADFYAIRREVLYEYNLEQYNKQKLAEYDENGLIPAAWHSTTHGLELSTNFLYRVKVTGYDSITGEPVERWFSVGSDDQLTKAQVSGSLSSMLEADKDYYHTDIEDMEIESALARADYWE
jgi:hypothetical protein